MNASDTSPPTHCGFVALIGAPNAGKSTLLNRLVGSKVAIVTRKVQTTRAILRGIAVQDVTQIIFVDTPGIFQPKRKLDRAMVEAAWSGASDADAVVLLVDAQFGLDDDTSRIVDGLAQYAGRAVLALNKIDAVKRDTLLALAQALNDRFAFDRTFMISALKGHGVDDLKHYLTARMPEGPWLYPEDQMADVPLRQMAAEVTREKLFDRLHDELPYASTVETEQWKELRDGSVRIEQTIFVERQSQKKIVLGHKGQTIKVIGQAAREELQTLLDTKVHLFVFVKVRERWSEDPERYRMMGLDYPHE